MKLSPKKKEDFQKTIWGFYRKNKRDGLVWRPASLRGGATQGKQVNPYPIWVSEIMLQQTQVDRVIPFFKHWMKLFPNVKKLANASQVEVLRAWKGLGYNSRALRMKKTAEIISKQYKGVFPKTYEEILSLPGIGPYTAGAIVAFAYDKPVAMIETNIRRVFIHHFFTSPQPSPARRGSRTTDSGVQSHLLAGEGGRRSRRVRSGAVGVRDSDLLELISETLPKNNLREWYWALMDYGSYLGKTIPNPNKKSRHYTIQKKFKGSDREIRGQILGLLLAQSKHSMTLKNIFAKIKTLSEDQGRIQKILDGLIREGFVIKMSGNKFVLAA